MLGDMYGTEAVAQANPDPKDACILFSILLIVSLLFSPAHSREEDNGEVIEAPEPEIVIKIEGSASVVHQSQPELL